MALQELALKKIRDLSELSNLSGYIPIDSSATGTRKFDASKLALAADVNASVSSLRRDVNSNVASIAALRSRLVAVENKVAGALSYIGEASIAEIEAMRIIDIENGSMYTMTEDGTIHYTLGGQAKTLEVEQYDEIAWGEKGWNIIGKDRRTDLSEYSKTSEFKPVAFSGDYNDLENKPTIPEVPVKEVTVGGQSVVNAQGTAEIPEIPTVPVKDVAIDGQSVVDGRGVANIPPAPDVPVQDVTVGGSSVLNAQGVAEIPQIPTVPVQDVTYGGSSVLNSQGVAEIPEAPAAPVQDVTYRGESIVNEQGTAVIPDPPAVPVQDVTVGGTSVLNSQGVAEIPQIPTVPVQDVTANGQSVVNEQGVAEIPDAPVKDVTVGGTSVLNASGVAEIPQIPTVPVQDVTYGGSSVVNAQGVAEIPEAPESPVQDVTYGGQSVLNEQGVAEIPEAPAAPVQDVTVGGTSVLNASGVAEIPAIPSVPVQDVTYGGQSVLNASGVAEIPEAPESPVQDVTVGGTSVLNAQGVAEIPQIPTVPVQDVTYGGQSVLNAQGVAEIPEAPAVPVQDVTYGGQSVLNAQGVAEIPEAPAVPVQDVTVGGSSVLNAQGVAEIPQIPTVPVQDVTVGGTSVLNAQGTAEIPAIPDAQIQSDWNQQDNTKKDFIKNKPSMVGKVHFLKAVGDEHSDVRAPYGYWIVDLEKPNSESPYGYDYAMAEDIMAKLSAGEVFVLSTYSTAPSPEEDLFIMDRAQDQSRDGHPAVRIWFTRMFASGSPEYMYFTTIYTPSMYNGDNNPLTGGQPEGRMAILNWRGDQSVLSEFRIMPYTSLASVATTGDYNDLANTPTIPAVPVQDVTVGGTSVLNAQGVAEIPAIPSPGLTAVAHDTTLNGNGTSESPLSVRMEAVITQVSDDIEEAVDAVKSRIIYTVGLSAVDNSYNHNGSHDTNGVFAKGTLFNPPMDFDLTDETRIVFSTNQSAGGNASKLYFAIYQYDAASKSVNWVANTDNCISFVQSSGYQAGFHFARLSHMKDGLTKFSSGKLYYFVMFTDDTNFKIAGNTYSANMNTFNGGTNLGLGAYLNSIKTPGGATAVITDGSDIENLVPTINWEGEYLTRIFAAITNVTEAPFIDLGGNVLPTGVDLAGNLPNFTPAAKNCVFMRVTPSSNCNVVAIEWIDSMSTLANWAERNSIYSDDYSVWLGSGNTVTSTTTAVGASLPDAYRHELRFATPISLVANTNYKIECECFDSSSSKLFSWSNPADYLEAYPLSNPPPTVYNRIIGKYLKITCLKDGVETSYVI